MKKIIYANLCFILIMFGMVMSFSIDARADEIDKQIFIGDKEIVDEDGNIKGEFPAGITYDSSNNKLTLNSYISNASLGLGDITLELKGKNTIKGGIDSGEIKICGGGSLTTAYILAYHKMEINNVKIDIVGKDKDYYFYGLELMPWQNYYKGYEECYIKIIDSTVNINNTVTYGEDIFNIGIDAQDADLIIQNSKVNIVVKNGVTWGYLTGLYREETGKYYGGLFSVDEKSNIKFQAINTELTSDNLYATYFYRDDIKAKYIYTGETPNGALTNKKDILNTHSWINERSECLSAFMEMTPTYRKNDNKPVNNNVKNPNTTKIKKIKTKKKALKVIWKKVKGVTGYKIQYSLKKNFKKAKSKTIKKASTTSLTIKKLKSKKKYYVRIRTYKKISGKTYQSNWSKAKVKRTK